MNFPNNIIQDSELFEQFIILELLIIRIIHISGIMNYSNYSLIHELVNQAYD